MKTTKLKGVTLYESTDQLPAKFSRESNGRLTVGASYKCLGICHVDATDTIQAWDGVLMQDLESKKEFPISLNTLLGVGFVKNEESWKVVTTSKTSFADAKEATAYANAKKAVKVIATESLTVQKYDSDETVVKNFYLFEKIK